MDISQAFQERLDEIDAYLKLLESLERQVQEGPPKIGGETITPLQQRILYSSVYLQLYNLVEATATWCVKAVTDAATANDQRKPGDLTAEVRREWVKYAARTHTDLHMENRLDVAVGLCDRLLHALPVSHWEMERSGGGSWDDIEFEKMAKRFGLILDVRSEARSAVKRFIREDRGPLGLVKMLRNYLAHGLISFSECGQDVTVTDLKKIKDQAELYLREVVRVVSEFVGGYKFLNPERRPVG